MPGTLYLIPAYLGEGQQHTLPEYIKPIINGLEHFIVENEKSARHFLKAMQITRPLPSLLLYPLNERTTAQEASEYLKPLLAGTSMGLISEAGCPAVADPGANIVDMCHSKGIKVVPLVGPSSILLALMASGFNGQNFAFVGYLPIEKPQRVKRIKELEGLAQRQKQTQIFIETPYRNGSLLGDIVQSCAGNTLLCIATDITMPSEQIQTKTITQWKKTLESTSKELHKRPTVFALYK